MWNRKRGHWKRTVPGLFSFLLIQAVIPPSSLARDVNISDLGTIEGMIHLGPAIRLQDGTILVGGADETRALVFRSTDEGRTWISGCDLGAGGSGDPVMGITQLVSGDVFFITNRSNGVYSSADAGVSCSVVGNLGSISASAAKLRSDQNRLYVQSRTELYYSDTNGTSWNTVSNVSSAHSSMFEITSTGSAVVGCCVTGPSELELSIASLSDLVFSKTPLGIFTLGPRPLVLIERQNGELMVVGGELDTWTSSDNLTFQDAGKLTTDNASFLYSGVQTGGVILLVTGSRRFGAQFLLSFDDGASFEPIPNTGVFPIELVPLDEMRMLGFEMVSFDGSFAPQVYEINVVPSTLTISPATGAYLQTQAFDLAIALVPDPPGLTIQSVGATLDGGDVTSTIAGCATRGQLSAGGTTFRCGGLDGQLLGPGEHEFAVSFTLSDGSVVTDEVRWTVLANSEGTIPSGQE